MEAKKGIRSYLGTITLSILALATLPVFIIRYLYGLGAISNLSDGRPWGLWISFDLYCGVALAAGGFTLAATVYIFNLHKYHPVIRPAILTAFLGYLLVVLALLVDLGQPWFIWHILISGNIHSPLFEVGVCVMTYTLVLALEFSPAVFEKVKWHVPLKVIRSIQIPLVIAGICLSTLHQSSLGTMLLMMPDGLDGLWYTPILPILFLNSAIAVGLAMVIFETSLSTRAFGHKLNMEVVSGLGKAIPWVLGLYLILKLGSLALSGGMSLVFTDFPRNILWWAEVLIGVVMPIILFSIKSIRENRRWVFASSLTVIFGLVLNRFDASMLALQMRPGYIYYPSLGEIAISLGLVVVALIVFQIAMRVLPLVEEEEECSEHKELAGEGAST